MKPAALLLVNVGVTCAAILAYHVATTRGTPPPAPGSEVSVPASAAVGGGQESRPAAGPGLQTRDLSETVDALKAAIRRMEERLKDLEDRWRTAVSRPTGTDGEGAAIPAGTGVSAAKPGDEDVAKFEEVLKKVEQRRARERDEATWRRRLKNAKIALPLPQEDEFVAAAAEYQEQVRGLFPGGSGGDTVEERNATAAKMEALRVALVEKVRARFQGLPAEEVERMFPPAPTTPMERAGPTNPAAMNR